MNLVLDYDEHEQIGDNTYIIHGLGWLPKESPSLSRTEFAKGKAVVLIYDEHRYPGTIDRIGELSMGVVIASVRVRSDAIIPPGMVGKKFTLDAPAKES